MHVPFCLLSVLTGICCLTGLGLDSPWAQAEEIFQQWHHVHSISEPLPIWIPLLLSTHPNWWSLWLPSSFWQGRQRWQLGVAIRPQGRIRFQGNYEMVLNGMIAQPVPSLLSGQVFFDYTIEFSHYRLVKISTHYGRKLFGESYFKKQEVTFNSSESNTLLFSLTPADNFVGYGQSQLTLAGMIDTAKEQRIFDGQEQAEAMVTFNPESGDFLGQGYYEIAAQGQVNTDTEQRQLQAQEAFELAAGVQANHHAWLTTRQTKQWQGHLQQAKQQRYLQSLQLADLSLAYDINGNFWATGGVNLELTGSLANREAQRALMGNENWRESVSYLPHRALVNTGHYDLSLTGWLGNSQPPCPVVDQRNVGWMVAPSPAAFPYMVTSGDIVKFR